MNGNKQKLDTVNAIVFCSKIATERDLTELVTIWEFTVIRLCQVHIFSTLIQNELKWKTYTMLWINYCASRLIAFNPWFHTADDPKVNDQTSSRTQVGQLSRSHSGEDKLVPALVWRWRRRQSSNGEEISAAVTKLAYWKVSGVKNLSLLTTLTDLRGLP